MSAKVSNTALITGLVLFSFSGISQDTLRKKPVNFIVKPTYLPGMLPDAKSSFPTSKNFIIDSLSSQVGLMNRQNDSLLFLLNDEVTRVRSLEKELASAREANQNLEKELDLMRGDQLQTTHKSSILLIFNVIVAIILLIALIWIFNKRKVDESPRQQERTTPKVTADPMERKMERIEKLGKLRDKGLLTDEEFLSQKKQILG